jgi:hypothetical protein
MLRIVGREESLPRRSVSHSITGRDDVSAVSAQYGQNPVLIAGPGRVHQRIGSLFGRLKGLLGAGHGRHRK